MKITFIYFINENLERQIGTNKDHMIFIDRGQSGQEGQGAVGDAYLSKKLRKDQSIQYIFLAERQKHLHHHFSPLLLFPLLLVMCVGTTQDNLNLSIIGPHVK